MAAGDTFPLGPGTLSIGATRTPIDVSCLVNNAVIAASKDQGDSVTKLCGTVKPGAVTYEYTLSGNIDTDIDDPAGFFALSQANPGTEYEYTFVPNTDAGTEAAGTLIVDPLDFGGDETGETMKGQDTDGQERQGCLMSKTAALEVEGADTLGRTLHGAADDLDDLETAAGQTGQLIRSRAAGKAPKVSGNLARSLVVEVSGSAVTVGSGLVYAGPIHYGWSAHNISAQPFLVPAAEDSESIWLAFYEKDVQSKLDKVRGT